MTVEGPLVQLQSSLLSFNQEPGSSEKLFGWHFESPVGTTLFYKSRDSDAEKLRVYTWEKLNFITYKVCA
jgi:hypothetical protein